MSEIRKRLWLSTGGLVALHVIHAKVQAGGGWHKRHNGTLGAFKAFFQLSFEDPVMSAGFSDFAAVAILLAAWQISELPAERRWTPKTVTWLGVYNVFPGLGALLYFLWVNPQHPFVAGRPAAAS